MDKSLVLFIPVFILLALCIVCAVKESAVTGKYKTFGVYGRVKAYLFCDMILAGPVSIIASLVPSLRKYSGFSPLMGIIIGVVCIVIGVLIFLSTKSKCPPGLQDKLLVSMFITGMGVSFKIAIFFLFFIWKITGPRLATDEYGNRIYIFSDGDVYSGNGQKIGHDNGDGTFNRYR